MPRKRRQSELPGADALYADLIERQHGVCAICGAAPKTRRLHIDHDHRTGKVRGLLCQRCNRALPNWVTAVWLRQAAAYLEPAALRDVVWEAGGALTSTAPTRAVITVRQS